MKKDQIKTFLLFLFILLMNTIISKAQINSLANVEGKWKFQIKESEVVFKIKNMYVLSVKGEMPIKSGFFNNYDDKIKISVAINVSSLSSGIKKRDDHLLSKDFFDVKEYPEIEFVGDNVSLSNNKEKYIFKTQGSLVIKGIVKKETVYFNIKKLSDNKISISGEAIVNRMDYKLDYEMTGMGDEATVRFKIIAVKQ